MSLKFNVYSIGGEPSGGGEVKNQNKTFTQNGVYTADAGYTGLGTVTVNVESQSLNLQQKTATQNGNVTPDTGYDGLSKVIVNVPAPTLIEKSITENGTFNAEDDNADGYSSVTVNVSGGGGGYTPEVRGRWVVPKAVSELDYEIANDSFFSTATGLGATCSLGVLFDEGMPGVKNISSSSIVALKTSDGAVYDRTTNATVEHVFDMSKDIVDPLTEKRYRWIIYYFKSPTSPSSSGDAIGNVYPSSSNIRRCTPYVVMYKGVFRGTPVENFYGLRSFRNIDGLFTSRPDRFVPQVTPKPGMVYVPPWNETYNGTCQNPGMLTNGNYLPPNLPYGVDFSDYNSTLTIGDTNGIDYNTNLKEAYMILPSQNVILKNGIYWSKDNWEYIADHAPTVSGKTLTMGEVNIATCGGSNSTIIQTLVNKGWTVN